MFSFRDFFQLFKNTFTVGTVQQRVIIGSNGKKKYIILQYNTVLQYGVENRHKLL